MDPAHVDDDSAASGQPIRCELVPLPQSYSGSFWTKAPPTPPPLVLDIGMQDAIRVIDRNTNALVASAPLAQVMATPAKYRHGGGDEAWYMDPLLIVAVPGFQTLSIRPAPMKYPMEYPRGTYRYSWREIDTVNKAEQPGYVVTEADWLALTERFGLSTRIVDDYASGNIARRNRRAMITASAWFALFLVLLALSAYLKYGR